MTGFSSRSAYRVQPAHAATLPRSPTREPKADRLMLKTVMEKHGFVNYAKEWWHYTLRDEPYPDTYFDFSVQ